MNNNFETIIKTKTDEYYTNNKKNTFFKSTQKIELAKTISESIDVNEYLKSVIYIDTDNNNHIFTSFPKLKPIIHPDNNELIVNYLDTLILKVLETYDHYYMHVDIFSLTVSNIHRMKPLIQRILSTSDTYRTNKLNKTYIYNSPSVIHNLRYILEPMFDSNTLKKVVYAN